MRSEPESPVPVRSMDNPAAAPGTATWLTVRPLRVLQRTALVLALATAGGRLALAEDSATATSEARVDTTQTGAAPVAPPPIRFATPGSVTAVDEPNDNGHALRVTWSLSADDALITTYDVYRVPSTGADPSSYVKVGSVPRGTTTFTYLADAESQEGAANPAFLATGAPATVVVRAATIDDGISEWSSPATGTPRGNWFHTGKVNILIATLLFGLAVVWFIQQSKSGRPLYIRPLPGINAVDEAIGRATEMGRPILFVLGTGTAGDIATIAGYTILARVAKKTAEYQTPLLVPVNDPVMMAMAQETVKEAYLQAGRPDVYRPESVYYISAMQFPYVAAVNGLMLRERTATNFYMGVFHAESLLLAEAGSMTGSIQISGTDQVSQIPFFVAATDYTLIGEELYAASAYLSQEPVLMGPLKAQDWAKIVILVFILLGVIAWTFGSDVFYQWVKTV